MWTPGASMRRSSGTVAEEGLSLLALREGFKPPRIEAAAIVAFVCWCRSPSRLVSQIPSARYTEPITLT